MKRMIKRKLLIITFISSVFMYLWRITGTSLNNEKKEIADGKYSYAIILGARVNGKVPSKSLQYRLDVGLGYAIRYPHVRFVLSGGQGPGEHISEAEAMRRYFIENNVEESRLILEDKSTSTYENIAFSLQKINEGIEGITIISSDYHLTRAERLVKTFELKADVIIAPTPNRVEKKMRRRERLALLKAFIFGK